MTNSNKKIVVFIKPNFVDFHGKIIQIFKSLGLETEVFQIESVGKSLIEELYREHQKQWYYEKLVSYYENKKIMVIFLSWSNIMFKVDKIIGSKDPLDAEKGTIREMFSSDSLEKANHEKRIIDNVIHFQNDEKKMEEEVKLFEHFTKNLSSISL